MDNLISIILPMYNSEKTIYRAVNSILKQTYLNFELIIINDGSTDNSAEIVNKFLKIDNRILFINRTQNLGLVYSLNEGIEIAKSNLIFRMDADDESVSNRLEIQYNFAKKINFNFSVIGTSYSVYIDDFFSFVAIHPSSKYLLHYYFIFNTYFCHPSTLINKNIYNKAGKYKNNYESEDYDLFARMLHKAPGFNINYPLLNYFSLKNGRSNINSSQIEIDKRDIGFEYIKYFKSSLNKSEHNIITDAWNFSRKINIFTCLKLFFLYNSISNFQIKELKFNYIIAKFNLFKICIISLDKFYFNIIPRIKNIYKC